MNQNPQRWHSDQQHSTTLWQAANEFAQRQPLLFVAGALAGGLLLGKLMQASPAPGAPPQTSFMPANRPQPIPIRNATPASTSRLGAREEQITRPQHSPSTEEIRDEDLGTSSAIFDLDPDALSPG